MFSKAVTENLSKKGAFNHSEKNPKGNTLYTDKTPNEDTQKCDPTKLKTHTHENRTRNNADVKVSERACRSRACGNARHTSSVLSSLFPNLFPITHLLWFLKAIAFLALCAKK